jgi:hypothetical protein
MFIRRVGKAKRAHDFLICSAWARRKGAFAHPTEAA